MDFDVDFDPSVFFETDDVRDAEEIVDSFNTYRSEDDKKKKKKKKKKKPKPKPKPVARNPDFQSHDQYQNQQDFVTAMCYDPVDEIGFNDPDFGQKDPIPNEHPALDDDVLDHLENELDECLGNALDGDDFSLSDTEDHIESESRNTAFLDPNFSKAMTIPNLPQPTFPSQRDDTFQDTPPVQSAFQSNYKPPTSNIKFQAPLPSFQPPSQIKPIHPQQQMENIQSPTFEVPIQKPPVPVRRASGSTFAYYHPGYPQPQFTTQGNPFPSSPHMQQQNVFFHPQVEMIKRQEMAKKQNKKSLKKYQFETELQKYERLQSERYFDRRNTAPYGYYQHGNVVKKQVPMTMNSPKMQKRKRTRKKKIHRRSTVTLVQTRCCVKECDNEVSNRTRFCLKMGHKFKQSFTKEGMDKICDTHYFRDRYQNIKAAKELKKLREQQMMQQQQQQRMYGGYPGIPLQYIGGGGPAPGPTFNMIPSPEQQRQQQIMNLRNFNAQRNNPQFVIAHNNMTGMQGGVMRFNSELNM